MTDPINLILKTTRENKKISLVSVHHSTRISLRYLEALESGQWDIFPAEIYLIGFLKKYALYLGLDAEMMLANYQRQIHGFKALENHQDPKREEIQNEKNSVWIKYAVFTFILFGFLLFGIHQVIQTSERPIKKHPALTPNGLIEKTDAQEPLILELQSMERVWIKILADGKLVFEGSLPAHTKRIWEGDQSFVIRVSPRKAVRTFLNGLAVDLRAGAHYGSHDVYLDRQSLDPDSKYWISTSTLSSPDSQ